MTIEISRNDDRQRYEIHVEGDLAGVAEFHRDGGTVVFPHTEIVPAMRGRGLASRLVGSALDDVRRSGATVVPRCWYVARFIDEHPDYADLVAR